MRTEFDAGDDADTTRDAGCDRFRDAINRVVIGERDCVQLRLAGGFNHFRG